ncbi:MAG TPA: UPF0280 family protein [Rhodospirillales bacterium]|nr:UPF0280 family protein [Rhodospirillales bacterium]
MEPARLSVLPPPGARAALLPDGQRLHLQHGPIDLIIEAFGPADAVRIAYDRAIVRFAPILDELVAELPMLRAPLGPQPPPAAGAAARRMVAAGAPHAGVFVTPMAAVAGAVADEVLAAMLADGHRLARAYVNDGGDIALYLAPGERFTAGLVADVGKPVIAATATIEAAMPVRGIATSGRGGRSLSRGIADAVTVLAADAAAADVAATLIANAVDADHPAVVRRPAREITEDSDLGELPVVVALGPLPLHDIAAALDGGLAEAERMQAAGLIAGAFLSLRGRHRATGLALLPR